MRWATLTAAVRASKDMLSTYARWRDLLARKL